MSYPLPAYADLLLHDMGPALADDVTVGEAGPSEFRTQPLWGIAALGPYLHDGRADTLDEAVRAHGGEALASERKYEKLASAERAMLVAFLESLGGSGRRRDGLLPKDAPNPSLGELGGPIAPLDGRDTLQRRRLPELSLRSGDRRRGSGRRRRDPARRPGARWRVPPAELEGHDGPPLRVARGAGAELSREAFDDVVFFMAKLAPPRGKALAAEDEARGSAMFARVG